MSDTYCSSLAEEFPDFPWEAVPPIPRGWKDISWRNDVSPSFLAFARDDGDFVRVWIDHPDPDERELCVKRYAAGWYDAEGSAHREHPFIESDDWNAILSAVLEEMRKSGVEGPKPATS